MSNSLRDELLKAGLVKPKAKQKVKPKSKAKKKFRPPQTVPKQPRQPQTTVATVADPDAKADKARQKLLRKQIKELLRSKRLNDDKAEEVYNFVVGRTVRRIYVTKTQHEQIIREELAIIPFGEKHYLVPIALKEDLLQLDPNLSIIVHDNSKSADSGEDDFPVPDDLIW